MFPRHPRKSLDLHHRSTLPVHRRPDAAFRLAANVAVDLAVDVVSARRGQHQIDVNVVSDTRLTV